MSRKTPLTCQSTNVNIVIRKNKKLPIEKVKEYCELYFKTYAFIEHEKDIQPTDGEVEGCHYHIVGTFLKNKTPFSTRLNDIVKFFKFDNENGIQIDKYITFEGSLQYLTHKNQPDKTQHQKSEIVHNLDPNDFEIFYNAEVGGVITYDELLTLCMDSNNIIEVIKGLGLNNYKTWRNVVWDMWKCLNGDEEYYKKS